MSIFGEERSERIPHVLSKGGHAKTTLSVMRVDQAIFMTAKDVEELRGKAAKKEKEPQKKRPKTAIAPFKPRAEFFNGTYSNFGKDAPQIAIGCSRRDVPPPALSPGPGAYNIPSVKISPMISTIPKLNKWVEPPSVTANADLLNLRKFPEIRPLNIGPKTNRSFYDLNDSPGPSFVPPTTLSAQTHKIASRTLVRSFNETVPGPGSYNPVKRDVERSPMYWLSGPAERDDWLKDPMNRPGPGEYSPGPNPAKQAFPKWSFGDKSRKRQKNNTPIAIDTVFIRLEPGMNREESLSYIEKHPQLKEFIHELIEEVIDQKPQDPLGYLQIHFSFLKEMRDAQQPKKKEAKEINFADLLK